MPTYASPRLTRQCLTTSLTITFLIGLCITSYAILHLINQISDNARKTRLSTATSGKVPVEPEVRGNIIEEFPSTSSPVTELIIGGVTLCHSILGIVATNVERPHLFSVHAYLLLMSCSIKLLLVVASTSMHMVSSGSQFWTLITQLALITCLIEIVLIFCGCQYAKLLKRGDAARQEIQSLHSYHLERRSRSRSRSVSRMVSRSMHGSKVTVQLKTPSVSRLTPTRWPTPSLSGVQLDELTLQPYDRYYYDQETDTFIVPPPSIFLQLDR